MNKYQVSLNRIKSIDLDVVRANMGEMRLGVSPYMVYDLPNLEMSKDINILQEAIDKAQKYDQLTEQLGCPVEVYVKLSQSDSVFTKKPERLLKENGNSSITNIIQSRITLGVNEFYIQFEIVNPYTSETLDIETVELLYKDYKKTWFLKEDKSE